MNFLLTKAISTLVIYSRGKSVDEEIVEAVFNFQRVHDRVVLYLRGFNGLNVVFDSRDFVCNYKRE